MFLSLNNDDKLTSKFIKAVNYELHETFGDDKFERVTQPPFLLSREGWGSFTVKAEIEFAQWTELPNLTVNHALSFQPQGSVFTTYISQSSVLSQLRPSLEKKNDEEL